MHFEALADTYLKTRYLEDVVRSYPRLERNELVLDMLPQVDRARILVIGCGPGPLIPQVIRRGFAYCGLDVSLKNLRIARETNRTTGFWLTEGDAEELPFQDNCFDVTLAVGVVEYVPNLPGVLQEMVRVTRNKGILIISFPHNLSPARIWSENFFYPIRNRIKRILRNESILNYKRNMISFPQFTALVHSLNCTIVDSVFFDLRLMPPPVGSLFPGFNYRLNRYARNRSTAAFYKMLASEFVIKAAKLY